MKFSKGIPGRFWGLDCRVTKVHQKYLGLQLNVNEFYSIKKPPVIKAD
jgi:hypothetical protein